MKIKWNDANKNPPIDNRDVIVYVPKSRKQLFYIAHYDIGDYIIRLDDKEIIVNGVTDWIDLPSFINPAYIDKNKFY